MYRLEAIGGEVGFPRFARSGLARAGVLLTVLATWFVAIGAASPAQPLCNSLQEFTSVYRSFVNGPNTAQDLALSPRFVPLVQTIELKGPKELRSYWKPLEEHYAKGVLRLREAGLNAQQLSDIARYDVVNGDNSADSMISAANPSAAVMAKVMVAFRQWQAVVDRYREPQLHGSALTAARGEFRDCNIQ